MTKTKTTATWASVDKKVLEQLVAGSVAEIKRRNS